MKTTTSLYVIGIDVGTGSTKGVAMTATGEVLATAQFFYEAINAQPQYSEQDPEKAWFAFAETIRSIIHAVKAPPACISLSSQMHGLLVLDKHNNVLTPLITWADSRSATIAESLRSSPLGEEIYRATGTPLHSMSPLCKIIWLQQNEPELFKASTKFISIKEYIWFRLFNVFEIDYSIASGTGLFNTAERNWNEASLQLAGIKPSQLSEPVSTTFIRSNSDEGIAALLQVAPGIPFCIGASDGCLANAGSFALDEGIAAVTIGTSGAVRVATKTPLVSPESMLFNYVLDETLLISGGAISNGGNVLQWLQENFMAAPKQDYAAVFDKIAALPPGAEGLICLPYLHGERAPIWDEKACGAFFGIKAKHTQANFLRAALEGVCYALNSIIDLIEKQGMLITQMNVSGGFLHSRIWLQMLADVTGKKLCIVQNDDASAMGAAILGLKALKEIESVGAIHSSNEIVIEPNLLNTEIYKGYYNLFITLYQTLKEPMHQLYQLNK